MIEFKFKKSEDSSGYLLWQVTTIWQRKIKRVLDEIDLTHTQFVLLASLAWLSKSQPIVTQIDIAKQSNSDRMMVSKVLRTLQSKKLITRHEHETDTRAKCIELTSLGREVIQKALALVESTDIEFFASLGENWDTFNKCMLTLIQENETLLKVE